MAQHALLLTFLLSLLSSLSLERALAQEKQLPTDLLDWNIEDLMGVDIDSVYGASKFRQKVTEAPASVTIITSEEIQKYGYRTLAEILRNVRGPAEKLAPVKNRRWSKEGPDRRLLVYCSEFS